MESISNKTIGSNLLESSATAFFPVVDVRDLKISA